MLKNTWIFLAGIAWEFTGLYPNKMKDKNSHVEDRGYRGFPPTIE